MSDEDALTLGNDTSGQGSGDAESTGDSGNGADDRGLDARGTDANPNPDNSDTDDDSDSLVRALTDGGIDSLDDNGDVKPKKDRPKTKAAPVEQSEKPATDEKPKAEETTPEESQGTTDDESDKPALTDEEQAEIEKAPNPYRKDLKKYFAERADLRAQVEKAKADYEDLKPVKDFTDNVIKHADAAGLISHSDGKIDAQAMFDLIEQERLLRGKPAKDVAKYYRDLANDLDPDGMPVAIPQHLRDLVETGALKQEEAEAIARTNALKAREPELNERRQRDAAARQEQQKRALAEQEVKTSQQNGYKEIGKIAQTYQKRFGAAEWDAVKAKIEAKLEPLLAASNPKAWGQLAETVMEATFTGRKAPLKTPPKTPAPTTRASSKADDIPSEEDDIKKLTAGIPL